MRTRRLGLILSCALGAAVLAVFLPVSGYDFVAFDDDTYVTENPRVLAGLSASGAVWAFTTMHAGNWHPLTWLSHMLDRELFGLDAGRHHITNLLLHLCNCLLFFSFLRGATGALWRSAFAAALFALHPLRVESVAWIAQRKDGLALFFLLLTLIAYRRYAAARTPGRYAAVCVLYAAGLMAKPTLVTLPIGLLLADVWPLGRGAGTREDAARLAPEQLRARRVLLEKIPLLLVAGATAITVLVAQSRGGAVNTLEEWSARDRLYTTVIGYVTYLGKSLFPAGLAVYYPLPREGFSAAAAAASLAVLIALAAFALAIRRRYPYVWFGWFWYLVTLLPVSGLLQAGTQAVADRYMLLPHLGLSVLASWAAADLLKRAPGLRAVLLPAALGVLLVLSLQTRRQLASWRDSPALFEQALAVTVDNWLIHYNYGTLLASEGRPTEAVPHLEAAIKVKPGDADAQNNLGNLLAGLGRAAEAEEHFRAALASRPDHVQALNNLGVSLLHRGENGLAVTYLSEAVARDPGYVDARFNLGTALMRAGNAPAAIGEFRAVLRLNPADAMARSYLELLLPGSR